MTILSHDMIVPKSPLSCIQKYEKKITDVAIPMASYVTSSLWLRIVI